MLYQERVMQTRHTIPIICINARYVESYMLDGMLYIYIYTMDDCKGYMYQMDKRKITPFFNEDIVNVTYTKDL